VCPAVRNKSPKILQEGAEDKPAGYGSERHRRPRSFSDFAARKAPIPGFGHPVHKPIDPRHAGLVRIAERNGFLAAMLRCSRPSPSGGCTKAQSFRSDPNATGAIGAVLCELGFPWQICRGIAVISRAGGLVGAYRRGNAQIRLQTRNLRSAAEIEGLKTRTEPFHVQPDWGNGLMRFPSFARDLFWHCLQTMADTASAESWPNKSIRWNRALSGRRRDRLMARVLAAQLTKSLGQSVIVENKAGRFDGDRTAALAQGNPTATPSAWVSNSLAINAVARNAG